MLDGKGRNQFFLPVYKYAIVGLPNCASLNRHWYSSFTFGYTNTMTFFYMSNRVVNFMFLQINKSDLFILPAIY